MTFFDSVALFVLLLLHCFPVCAIPLEGRQANNLPQTVTTVNTAVSAMGTVTVTCVIVLTPIKDSQGRDVVREVKTCTLAVNGSQSSSGSSSETTPTTSTTPNVSPSTTLPPDALSTVSPAVSSSTITTFIPTVTDTNGGLPSSTIFTTTSTIDETPLDTGTPTSVTSVQASPAGVSGVAAAADSSMPGKKLSVLPIGLGVFAGISVIALIVVGLVTYERTKYRKAFRQRKLAETGASMGYGGMGY